MRQFSAAQPANYINHIVIVADASGSMARHQDALVKVADNVVAHLAERSRFHDQETRITFYDFSGQGDVRCLFYDKDVLRMPSISGLYRPRGMTALIDASLLAIHEGEQTAQLHGEHAFLLYLLSDGLENVRRQGAPELSARIAAMPGNWTFAAFAPDQQAVFELKRCGIPADNIAVWDTTSAVGVEKVGDIIRQSTESFMEGRTHGIHGYNARSGTSGGLFRIRDFSASEVRTVLTPVTEGAYFFLEVGLADRDTGSDGVQIDRLYERKTQRAYPKGRCYYQLGSKKVKVQDYKDVLVEASGVLYSGSLDQARGLLGLPDHAVDLTGDQLPAGVTVFVQSTSMNRKLFPGTRLLVLR